MPTETRKRPAVAAKKPDNRKKQMLVVVLLLGLLLAIITQPSSEPEDESASPSAATTVSLSSQNKPTVDASTTAAGDPAAGPVETAEQRIARLSHIETLSRIELSALLATPLMVNPPAPPPPPPAPPVIEPPAPEPPPAEPAAPPPPPPPRVKKVHAVYGTAQGHAALIGQEILHPGQPLPDGREILSVTPDGVQTQP